MATIPMRQPNGKYFLEKDPDEQVNSLVLRMLDFAQKLEEDVYSKIFGVVIVAHAGDDQQKVVQQLVHDLTVLKEHLEHVKVDMESAQALMNKLPALEWDNTRAVLHWLRDMQPYTCKKQVKINGNAIFDAFSANGFEPNANVGAGFKADDPDNSARYIIGQALENIKNRGTIDPLAAQFIEQWEARFPL